MLHFDLREGKKDLTHVWVLHAFGRLLVVLTGYHIVCQRYKSSILGRKADLNNRSGQNIVVKKHW